MIYSEYIGSQVLCAAYAFFNTLGVPDGEPELYELLSSVPFGIKHLNGDLKRLITPYANPNDHIAQAANLLGYRTDTVAFDHANDIISFFEQNKILGKRYMIGPVDMGFLLHLPQCVFYSGQDHYFTVEISHNNKLFVIDSEGTSYYLYNLFDLPRILSVKNISEANGKIHVRSIEKVNERKPCEEIRRTILAQAVRNMKSARDDGQGSKAFSMCYEWLNATEKIKWKLSFIFDLHFFIQRKFMLLKFFSGGTDDPFIHVICKQIDLTSKLRQSVIHDGKLNRDDFVQIAKLEDETTELLAGMEAKLWR